MTSHSQINEVGSTLGVHACGEHDVLQLVLLLKMVSVEDDSEVNDLSQKTDWWLRVISVNSWHIEIINEEEQVLSSGWTIVLSSSSVDLTEDDSLESL
jgi:hypothetical protein